MTPGMHTALELAELRGWRVQPLPTSTQRYLLEIPSSVFRDVVRMIEIEDSAWGLQTLCTVLGTEERLL